MPRIELTDYRDSHDGEGAPFLVPEEHPDGPIPGVESEPDDAPRLLRAARPWQVRSPSAIVALICLVKFLSVTCALLLFMPIYRVIEDIFCHIHYQDDSPGFIDEMKCKADEVQSDLAFMMGWLALVGSVLNLIVTYPYGMMADRMGRKPTVLLSFGGLAASFYLTPFMLGPSKDSIREHPYILLIGTMFTLIGGGIPVLITTLFAMISDVSTEKNKGSNFLYATLGAKAGALLGPLLAGILMERWEPWVPITASLCILPAAFVALLLIPETMAVKTTVTDAVPQPPLVALRNHVSHGIRDMRKSLSMVKDRNIFLCLVCFFFNNARFTADTSTLTQYISKHFGWTIGETTILLSPLGVLQLIVLGCLPVLSNVLTSPRFGYTAFRKDTVLCRSSLLILVFSALIRAFSTNIGLFIVGLFVGSFGTAEGPLARAIMTSYVDPAYTSRLYAVTQMVEIAGAFVGGPVLAWCFNKGLEWRGIWTGLPWLYLALICLISWITMLLVRPPRKDWDDSNIFGEGVDEADSVPSNPVRLD